MSTEIAGSQTVELKRPKAAAAKALIQKTLDKRTQTLGGDRGFLIGDLTAFTQHKKVIIETRYEITRGLRVKEFMVEKMARGTTLETGTAQIIVGILEQLLDKDSPPEVTLIPAPTDSIRADQTKTA